MPSSLKSTIRRRLGALGAIPQSLADLALAGIGSTDIRVLRAELFARHRVRRRRFVAKSLPRHGVGVELGVFTGLFSTQLLRIAKPRKAYFVDVWWTGFGERFGDWGAYTDHGRLTTRLAHAAAVRRIARAGRAAETEVVVADALEFLRTLPDRHLDWAYLDAGHQYEDGLAVLGALLPKLRPGAIVAGDDWCDDPAAYHHGGTLAVRKLIDDGALQLLAPPRRGQWLTRATT